MASNTDPARASRRQRAADLARAPAPAAPTTAPGLDALALPRTGDEIAFAVGDADADATTATSIADSHDGTVERLDRAP